MQAINRNMSKKKYYVVWKGVEPGVYVTWIDCKRQIDNYEGALYKSFDSKEMAEKAYSERPWEHIGKAGKNKAATYFMTEGIIRNSLAVDAACSGNPGKMEYRGVHVDSRTEIFHVGPYEKGTNNIGEFLAIVHGLAWLKKNNIDLPIYSDSVNAMLWIKNKQCKTKLLPCEENAPVFELITRAENWLRNNTYSTRILKWETAKWGEIPADFGRK